MVTVQKEKYPPKGTATRNGYRPKGTITSERNGLMVPFVVVVVDVDFQLFTDGMAPKFFLTPLSHVSTLSTVAHP